MTAKKSVEDYDEKEAQERFEAALRGALKTPHEPLKEKPKVKKKPGKSGRASGGSRDAE